VAEPLSADRFAPFRGTAFAADPGDGGEPVALWLDKVTPGRPQPGAPRENPFSLDFTGAADRPLGQGLYELSHPVLGTVAIFVVPLGPGPDGRPRYEAIFN
jgi:hypothetical protein